jgi:hypothetical protein
MQQMEEEADADETFSAVQNYKNLRAHFVPLEQFAKDNK